MSVGIVGERDYLFSGGKQLETVFSREVRKNQWIQEHLEPGIQADRFRTTGDFSYRSQFCAMDGLVLAGDAFAFLDPVFSSGVLLALKSGELAGDAIDRALAESNVTAEQFRSYGEVMCHGIEAMRKLVYSFYDNAFSFKSVLMAHPHLLGDLTDCLIGHIDRDFDELFDAVRCFACLPDPISHGGPKERMVENRSNHAGYR